MDRQTVRVLVLVGVLVGAAGVAVAAFSNPAPIDGGVPLAAPGGLQVVVEGDSAADLQGINPQDDTLVIETVDGNVTMSSGGTADATIATTNITGTWTSVTGINAGFTTVTIDPEDKAAATVGKDISYVQFRAASEVAADDGTPDFVYAGPDGTTSRVTIQGAPADTQLGAVDRDSAQLLDVATSDSSGQITFDQLDNSEHTVELQTSDGAPNVSNPSPTGDLSTPPTELAATVDDPDFPSDNVSVTISLDGSELTTEQIGAKQEVTATIPDSGKTAGEHTWTVEATDEYGQTTTETYSYRVPDTLYIRNESNHSQLVDSPTEVEVQFFGEDQIFTRTTSDGTVNLTGLPVDQDFIVSVDPDNTSNWTSRTVYIQTIYEQQSVYLFNTSTGDTVTSRFVLEDPTGQFGPGTVLYIQKPINVSGTTTYQTIHADEFGAEGVTAELEQGQRYRLKVENTEGVVQVVGPYRADVSETVTVRPGTPQIEIGELTDGWGTASSLDNTTLSYRYADPDGETDELTVVIYERGNKSNLLVPNETYFDLGNVSNQLVLTEEEKKKTWVVRYEVTRDGEEFVTEDTVSNRPEVLPDLSREWRLISGILLLVLSAGAFSLLNATTGVVVVSTEGALLWWIGWLEGATTGVLVVFALFIAIMLSIYNSGRP